MNMASRIEAEGLSQWSEVFASDINPNDSQGNDTQGNDTQGNDTQGNATQGNARWVETVRKRTVKIHLLYQSRTEQTFIYTGRAAMAIQIYQGVPLHVGTRSTFWKYFYHCLSNGGIIEFSVTDYNTLQDGLSEVASTEYRSYRVSWCSLNIVCNYVGPRITRTYHPPIQLAPGLDWKEMPSDLPPESESNIIIPRPGDLRNTHYLPAIILSSTLTAHRLPDVEALRALAPQPVSADNTIATEEVYTDPRLYNQPTLARSEQ